MTRDDPALSGAGIFPRRRVQCFRIRKQAGREIGDHADLLIIDLDIVQILQYKILPLSRRHNTPEEKKEATLARNNYSFSKRQKELAKKKKKEDKRQSKLEKKNMQDNVDTGQMSPDIT
ncbi:MAG: hypothetical protein KJ995_01280 [Candidatus Omnitrophica bacterium]|nr:hypothetical protein [Candidatus Omnitrophota bacterium]MBU1128272.1 hypothetical protein [Candidatus Omnitrophota bacterium]MBU1656964.1 hypothetical protein [Candidatus Omnitrophota bacterium]MBU1784028.1 hypothetical protein [Candidatus Omnitrophota bacterium]MBU1851022.1 hypothetical protein [Candidatus Omnitrophota bacterium]